MFLMKLSRDDFRNVCSLTIPSNDIRAFRLSGFDFFQAMFCHASPPANPKPAFFLIRIDRRKWDSEKNGLLMKLVFLLSRIL